MSDSRVADVNPGVDLVEVLCGEAVEAAAVGQELVELLHRHLCSAVRRDISRCLRRRLLLLFAGAQVFLHGSSSSSLSLMLDKHTQPRTREPRPIVQLHFTFARESCARCLLVSKVSEDDEGGGDTDFHIHVKNRWFYV